MGRGYWLHSGSDITMKYGPSNVAYPLVFDEPLHERDRFRYFAPLSQTRARALRFSRTRSCLNLVRTQSLHIRGVAHDSLYVTAPAARNMRPKRLRLPSRSTHPPALSTYAANAHWHTHHCLTAQSCRGWPSQGMEEAHQLGCPCVQHEA